MSRQKLCSSALGSIGSGAGHVGIIGLVLVLSFSRRISESDILDVLNLRDPPSDTQQAQKRKAVPAEEVLGNQPKAARLPEIPISSEEGGNEAAQEAAS